MPDVPMSVAAELGIGVARLGPPEPAPTIANVPAVPFEATGPMDLETATMLRREVEQQIVEWKLTQEQAAAYRARKEAEFVGYGAAPLAPPTPPQHPTVIEQNRDSLMPDNATPGQTFAPHDYDLNFSHNIFASIPFEQRGPIMTGFKQAFSELSVSPLLAQGLCAFLYQNKPDRLSESEKLDRLIQNESVAVRKWGEQEWVAMQARAKAFVAKSPMLKQISEKQDNWYLKHWWWTSTLNRIEDTNKNWAAMSRR